MPTYKKRNNQDCYGNKNRIWKNVVNAIKTSTFCGALRIEGKSITMEIIPATSVSESCDLKFKNF